MREYFSCGVGVIERAGAVAYFDVEWPFTTALRTIKDAGSQCSILEGLRAERRTTINADMNRHEMR